jgi:glutaredoxin 3
VVVFSKSYCPYCTSTKTLFSGMKVNAKVIELDKMDNGSEIQSALLDITGQRTVPNVFIKGKHLGGNDVTQAAAKSGKLKEMMAQ